MKLRRTHKNFSAEEKWVTQSLLYKDIAFNLEWNWEKAFSFAQKNGVAPYLYFKIVQINCQVPTDLNNALKKAYLTSLLRNTHITNTWKQLKQLIDSPVIPLKGIFLARHIYPDIALRPMSDIDILLSPHHAKNLFEQLNTNPANESNYRSTDHHLPGILFNNTLLEIHQSLFPDELKINLYNDDIWKSTQQYQNELNMSPHLNLIYLCLHIHYTMKRGGIRLSWFLDLVLLTQSDYFKAEKYDFEKFLEVSNTKDTVVEILNSCEYLLDYEFPFLSKYKSNLSPQKQERLISLLTNSNQQDLKQSYSIAWERLKRTKGLKKKISFAKDSILKQDNTNAVQVIKRISTLSYRFFKMLIHNLKNED